MIDKISTSGATVEELVADIAGQSPLYDFDPGTGWWYSNSNYALLGAVIEKVSGKTWAAFMKAEIFDKLGMADTAADDAHDVVPGRASGYSLIGGAAGKFRNADFTDMSVPYAAGALRSTAEDMARWNAALFGGKLLKPQSLKEMLAPGRLRNGAENQTAVAWPGGKAFPPPAGFVPGSYAFGLDHHSEDGRRIIGHDGSIAGVRFGDADLCRRRPDHHRPDEHGRRSAPARGEDREDFGALTASWHGALKVCVCNGSKAGIAAPRCCSATKPLCRAVEEA